MPCCASSPHCLCFRLRILEAHPRRRSMCSPYTCAYSLRLRVLRQLCLLCPSGALNEARALQLAGGESAVGPRSSTLGRPNRDRRRRNRRNSRPCRSLKQPIELARIWHTCDRPYCRIYTPPRAASTEQLVRTLSTALPAMSMMFGSLAPGRVQRICGVGRQSSCAPRQTT